MTSWRFRRYQKLLDVEIWVPGNSAVGHTATYVRKDAEREGRIRQETMASAFVTRYEQERGVLRAMLELVQRLKNEAGYEVEVQSPGGVLVISITGQGESWALWYSAGHVIKVGGRGLASVPEDLVEAYGERYPSRLTDDVLDRPLPPEDTVPESEEAGEAAYDPDNPSPDWQEYQSGAVERQVSGPAGQKNVSPDDQTDAQTSGPKAGPKAGQKNRKKPAKHRRSGKK
ncbi:MAG TPA: hypothetical protein VNM90_06665 [Haliangium sp.]|nr:hypothetical protein [Haliangium sp.]